MKIVNPFILNDLDIKTFFAIILSLHLMVWGALGLDIIGFKLPIFRQIIGFIYLTFVPGIVFVRVLKLHKLRNVELLLHTIGLSILIVMFTSISINGLYLYFGIKNPISTLPILIALNVIVLILCILCYVVDKDFSSVKLIDVKELLSSKVLFLCTLPFFSIFGTYLVNFYDNNILLMCLIIMIVLIVVLITLDVIPKILYPYCLFIISISLLYHSSLISMYLTGWDIHYEYYYSSLVKTAGYLDLETPAKLPAMLSISILPTIYSNICNLSIDWVFKIIYPFLFSFISLGIYHIYQKQINNDKIAFFSVFYFVSVYVFYTEMVSLARQQIAELFFVLIILVMLSEYRLFNKRILVILYSFGLITSHYGLSYLFILFCIVGYVFMKYYLHYHSETYTISFISLFFVILIFWYMLFTSGYIFESVTLLFRDIYNSILTDIFNPETGATPLIAGKSYSLSGDILKRLYLISQFFIVVGFLKSLVYPKIFNFSKEYMAFSIVLLSVLVVSFFTSSTGMNIHRLYHISSIALSLFCVIGAITIFDSIYKFVLRSHSTHYLKHSLKLLSIFLILFMLFNVGFVQEILKDEPRSISLSQERMKNSGIVRDTQFLYGTYFTVEDIYGTKWLSKNRKANNTIYSDLKSSLVLYSYGSIDQGEMLNNNTNEIEPESYIYLRYPNVKYGWMNGPLKQYYWNTSDISETIYSKSFIYSNGGNKIYL